MASVLRHPAMCRLEVHFECQSLVKLDRHSKSDPCLLLYSVEEKAGVVGEKEVLLGKTEILKDTSNPKFQKSFELEYHFEESQLYRVRLVDVDKEGKNDDIKESDEIGSTYFHLSQLASAPGMILSQALSRNRNRTESRGICVMRAEEVAASSSSVVCKFQNIKASNLQPFAGGLPCCGPPKLKPVLWITRATEGQGGEQVIYKGDVPGAGIDGKNFTFGNFELSIQKLCNGDYDRPVTFKLLDAGGDSGQDDMKLVGSCQTSLNQLLKMSENPEGLTLARPEKEFAGTLKLIVLQETRPSMLDYIRGGLQLNLHVAIDFTASNGAPTDPSSLHSWQQGGITQYEQVLIAVGNILRDYDSDKMIPVYGFGGQPPDPMTGSLGAVSHCFALNLANPGMVEACDIAGVDQFYRNAISVVQLSGPTLFAPLLGNFVESIKSSGSGANTGAYHILLIMTDGAIHDIIETVNQVVESSFLPISIIIVGVGKDDFSAMHFLDADNGKLRSARTGKEQERDNVQFVAFRDCANSESRLASQVLFELPNQIVSYFEKRGIKPNPPRPPPPPPQTQTAVMLNFGIDPAVGVIPVVQQQQVLVQQPVLVPAQQQVFVQQPIQQGGAIVTPQMVQPVIVGGN